MKLKQCRDPHKRRFAALAEAWDQQSMREDSERPVDSPGQFLDDVEEGMFEFLARMEYLASLPSEFPDLPCAADEDL